MESETDFAFEGILQLVWSRSYYSDQDGIGWLGEGWSVPGCQRIIRDAAGLAYIDDQGRLFPLLEVDEDDEEPVLFESEQIWFSKKPGRAVCQNAAAVGVAAGGFARLR